MFFFLAAALTMNKSLLSKFFICFEFIRLVLAVSFDFGDAAFIESSNESLSSSSLSD
jgi:hypothetical protein